MFSIMIFYLVVDIILTFHKFFSKRPSTGVAFKKNDLVQVGWKEKHSTFTRFIKKWLHKQIPNKCGKKAFCEKLLCAISTEELFFEHELHTFLFNLLNKEFHHGFYIWGFSKLPEQLSLTTSLDGSFSELMLQVKESKGMPPLYDKNLLTNFLHGYYFCCMPLNRIQPGSNRFEFTQSSYSMGGGNLSTYDNFSTYKKILQILIPFKSFNFHVSYNFSNFSLILS